MDLDPTQLIRFYKALPAARQPIPASKSAAGTMYTKATQHCVPMTAAASDGWYVGLPCDLKLRWNGFTTIEWWLGNDDYHGVLNGENSEAMQYPGFAQEFALAAPEELKRYSPPFIKSMQEPGVVGLWAGWLVRTALNWSVEVRPIVNYPRPEHYEVLPAIVETDDWWFGPLPTNLRLAQTDKPIYFPAHRPLFQLQLKHRKGYQGPHLTDTRVLHGNVADGDMLWDAEDWRAYAETVAHPRDRRGEYAYRSRRRGPASEP